MITDCNPGIPNPSSFHKSVIAELVASQ